jgi:benzoyl-CoA reductase/2-hydroxyglutaryl-CoA dehydratase subunit BcrC/BadD/HgdB
MSFWALGSERGLRFFEALKERVEKAVREKKGYLEEERFRVLWLHHIRPYYPNPIMEFLKEKGVAIAYEEANYPWWPERRGEDPLEDVAEKMLSNPWYGPIEGRLKLVRDLILEYQIDGVIHFSHWGCRQSTGGASIVGEMVKGMGIPYLILPGDGADPDNYSPGQTLTRLQAFVELMERRWRFMRA